jgi:hypothetical protein
LAVTISPASEASGGEAEHAQQVGAVGQRDPDPAGPVLPIFAGLPVLVGPRGRDMLDRHGPVGEPGGGGLDRQRIGPRLAPVGLVLAVRQRHQILLLHIGQEHAGLGQAERAGRRLHGGDHVVGPEQVRLAQQPGHGLTGHGIRPGRYGSWHVPVL